MEDNGGNSSQVRGRRFSGSVKRKIKEKVTNYYALLTSDR